MATTSFSLKTHAPAAKICGLSQEDDVAAALAGGAALIGFVFFEKSPRNVTPERAAELAAPARGRAKIVAVTVDADDATLQAIVETLRPDYVQLHGKEGPDRVREVKARFGVEVIKALRVATLEDVAAARAFEGVADLILYDAAPPKGADLPGGNGEAFDWSLVAGLAHGDPWFLAGGLNPLNVAAALKATRAPLVDVSSGVERAPGCKDPSLISAFLKAVRSAGGA
jgi:phosphoribosylanthranilate isomerase